ncbi:hypothetical protein [Flaviaesturariibacter amylovorans]|uniref:GlyGly-CTERM sorting domain-containing protein n=1 Tax=Flaviaesturariibacter amylovorans TaxID=1084520 RepID=A0ABP8GW83_9BACT
MKKACFSVLALIVSTLAWAQEEATKTVDVNINTKSESAWYTSPVVWVIGAAVFILLLVALTRGRRA